MSAKENTGDTGGMFFNHQTEENIYERFSPKNSNGGNANFNYMPNQALTNKNQKSKNNPIYKSQIKEQDSHTGIYNMGNRAPGGMGQFPGAMNAGPQNKMVYGGQG
jgi:hypothetical protein